MKATAVKTSQPVAKPVSVRRSGTKPVAKAAAPAKTVRKPAVPAKAVAPQKSAGKKAASAKKAPAQATVKKVPSGKVAGVRAVPKKAERVKTSASKVPQPLRKAVVTKVAKAVVKTAVKIKGKALATAKTKQTTAKVAAPQSVTKKATSVKSSAIKAPKAVRKAVATTAAKPPAKTAAKGKALAVPQTKQSTAKVAPARQPTRAAKPVPKTAAAKPLAAPAKTRATKPAIKPIAPSQAPLPAKVKSSQSASPVAARPIPAKSSKVSDKSKPTPSTFQSPNPATLAELGMPVRTGRPSSRLVQLTVPSIAQSVASTGAKASFTPMAATHPIASPLASSVKKNRKLVDNWKNKPVAELTDEEVIAMSDDLYMNDTQLAFFRMKLQVLKNDILNNADKTTATLRTDTVIVPDPADRATIEEEHALELRTRDRERKLLKKIEQSIGLIDTGEYGYCDETGEPIGVGRLLARPTATLSLEAQQRRELKQRMFGD